MLRITQDDIQRIGDEATLMHFLEEKLNLPIPEDLTLEDITTKFAKFALGLGGGVANQVLDCQELSVSLGESSGIILIRFNNESGYTETLRAIAEGLDRLGHNSADLRFICMNEYCQPFAFAYFKDLESGNWQDAVLIVLAWTQENTHIHTGSEHELPTGFFPKGISKGWGKKPTIRPMKVASPKTLLAKLKNTGTPLSYCGEVYSGILTGFNKAYVIDEVERQWLISQDIASRDLIKPLLLHGQKWKTRSKYLIWIPTSEHKRWPWSEAKGETAERIFEKEYPAISAHLKRYENKLRSTSHHGKFYWELTKSNPRSMPKQSKIVYSRTSKSMRAAYDTSEALPLFSGQFIPTEDLTLLAILNSRLFDWYVQQTRKVTESNSSWAFKLAFMRELPIAEQTDAQKETISDWVRMILADPTRSDVPDIEKEINELVYELYELTDAEKALIKN